MTSEKFRLRLDILRHPKIVSVKECDQIPLGCTDPRIARSGKPTVLLLEIQDTVTEGLQRLLELLRIRRAVIDNDHLKGRLRLRKDGLEGLGNIRSHIVCRNDHAHALSA